ncbi:MerC domain-containing protein [Hydrotalea sp.]|uniref:MerC domain-containing protein n=1 Tax=Hydrotalea sp. TaxID=2881279 RepID=UPI0026237AA1|nr:MerC domain-containing protein [Hydrotalea sp.]
MQFKKVNWDMLGIVTSVACAIHCALLPIILTSLPLFGIEIIHNRAFEFFMIFLAFVIGAFSLLRGYLYKHHQLKPLIVFSLGILFLLSKQIWHRWEIVLLIPAVILIVYGHLLNNKTCHYRHTTSNDTSGIMIPVDHLHQNAG